MVCGAGSGKMSALTRLLDPGSVSPSLTVEEVVQPKLAAQHIKRELLEAHEANLFDEEDMDIFGLRPMTDPLNLVCCNACKKPIKASQYAAHLDFCKSLSTAAIISMGNAVDGTPQRKERKKILNTRRKKVSSVGEPRKYQSVNSGDIATPGCDSDEQIQMIYSAEEKLNMFQGLSKKQSDPPQGRCSTKTMADATKPTMKPVKGMVADHLQNADVTSSCRTVEVLPYAPAPLATKMYYSQRTHHLRAAIRHMFFESSKNESNSGFSNADALQLNAVSSSNSYLQQDVGYQEPSQAPALYEGKSSGVPQQTTYSHPINDDGAASYNPDPYSFISNSVD